MNTLLPKIVSARGLAPDGKTFANDEVSVVDAVTEVRASVGLQDVISVDVVVAEEGDAQLQDARKALTLVSNTNARNSARTVNSFIVPKKEIKIYEE